VGFELLVAVIASLSNCDSMVIGNPFSVKLRLGGDGGERGSGVARSETRQMAEFRSIHAEGAGTLDVEVRTGQPAIGGDAAQSAGPDRHQSRRWGPRGLPDHQHQPNTGLRLKVSVLVLMAST
jgi:hypothetical protein